jgi:transcriptional regulator with GAF, ATPase, and Fis domain
MVWRSEAMRKVVAQAQRLGKAGVPVLITGETGTGKEVLARTIHECGDVSRPFVPIDCSAFASELLESELFGHVRGAFTGAFEDKPGLIELAGGGTAFFDEIGELPLHLQAKLLRLLQEREYRPVGSSRFKKIEFRAIAATNRDLRAEVRAGRFREDLYYRLAVVRLHLPPLRERRDDIPMLVGHFLARTGSDREIPPHVIGRLAECDWPGNVRQLENCVACMTVVDSCPLVEGGGVCENLQPITRSQEPAAPPVAEVPFRQEDESGAALLDYERRAIVSALHHAKGNVARAAMLLGMGRTTIYRKIRTYGLDEADCR